MKKLSREEMTEFLSLLDHYAMISRCDGIWTVTLLVPGVIGESIVARKSTCRPGELPLHPIAESVISAFIDRGAERVHVRYDLVDVSIVVDGWAAVKLYNFALDEIDRLREVREELDMEAGGAR